MSEGYPASWVRLSLRVGPDGEMHAVGGDRDGNPEIGDCPYIGLDRIRDRIKRDTHREVAAIQSDMQECDQRRQREYEALSDQNAILQARVKDLESQLAAKWTHPMEETNP